MPGPRDAPGRKSMLDADDRAVAGEEDDVDREAHEEHVYRAGPIDEHSAARLESVAAEQASRSPERALRHLAALADDGTVRASADARARCTGCGSIDS